MPDSPSCANVGLLVAMCCFLMSIITNLTLVLWLYRRVFSLMKILPALNHVAILTWQQKESSSSLQYFSNLPLVICLPVLRGKMSNSGIAIRTNFLGLPQPLHNNRESSYTSSEPQSLPLQTISLRL